MRIFLVNPDLNLNTFKIKYVRNLFRNFLIFFKISLMKICEGRKSMDQWNCVSELERKKTTSRSNNAFEALLSKPILPIFAITVAEF